MRPLLIAILFCLTTISYAQGYLESDETKLIFTDFGEGIPSDITSSFSNFKQNTEFGDRVQGLLEKPYITTNANRSSISIDLDNIGRVVIYAKLFNENDSILFNPLSIRNGTITLIPYRDGQTLAQETSKIIFDEDIFQQVHYNVRKAGVNKIEIIFDSQNDLFILEKLKIVPLNARGINYYKELENSEKAILDMADNLENNAALLKTKYEDQIEEIQEYHKNLSNLISGNAFETVSITKANSLNPFRNGDFLKHYESVLENVNAAERAKIETASKQLGASNFANIAVTLGNLYTGGSFSSLINLIGGAFDKSISLSKDEPPLLKINSQYYHQKESRDGLKLTPIKDEATLNQIKELTAKNDAFKTYVSTIISFTKEDLETMNELNEKIHLAKIIRSDLEDLTWAIVDDYTDLPKEKLIDESDVNFFKIGGEMNENFKTDAMDMSSFQIARSESITSISKFNELSDKYSNLTSKIKTHYDFLYENRPKNRANAFDHLASDLPPTLILDWVNGQKNITIEYTKDDGLKQFLSNATGKE